MGTNPAGTSSLPSDRTLDQAVTALAERGDHVGLIQLVEAWSAQGAPTQQARLLAGQSFFRLRLMDRAMARAREVLEQDPENPEALRLLGRVYLERGWPAKARAPLAVLRAARGGGQGVGGDDPELDELWERAQADPLRPDVNARAIEREGDPGRLITLAETFLATGSFLRATGILERLRRGDPDNPRIRELLWGIAGDYSAGEIPLSQMIDTLLPAMRAPRVLAEEPEHTESVTQTRVDVGPLDDDTGEAVADHPFPTLFKHGPAVTVGEDDPAERTESSHLATRSELAGGAPQEGTDPSRAPSVPAHGDTQILLVLRPGEEAGKASAHRRREGPRDPLRESLNLREYQASMGMSAPLQDITANDIDVDDVEHSEARPGGGGGLDGEEDDGDLLEEEDQDLVVMTRRESAVHEADEEPARIYDRPIEVIEKHGVPLVPPPPQAAPEPPPITEEIDPFLHDPSADAPQPSSSNRWVIVGLGALALAMMAAFVLVVGGRVVSGFSDGDVREGLIDALASADYERLLQRESVLDAEQRGKSLPNVTAALAEARLVLWSDFNGDPARMDYVMGVVANPVGFDVHRLAMLRAEVAAAREDWAGASAAIGREQPQDDEERLLYARLAARTQDRSRALEHFTKMRRPDAPRYALARAEILAGFGANDEAVGVVDAVLKGEPEHLRANLARVQLRAGAPMDRIAAADFFLSRFRARSIAPRIEGQVHAVRARAYAQYGTAGKAREAADAGLARDGTNPELLLIVADDEARRGELDAALHEIETIVASRPGNAEAQAARLLLLLDLDRVDAAEAAATSLREARLLPELLPILEGLVTVWGRSSPPVQPITPAQAATPLGSYLAALGAVQARAPDAATLLTTSADLLKASPAPFERRLAPRVAAMVPMVTPAGKAPSLVEDAEAGAGSDPFAHVFLGRYYEAAGRRAAAAQHFDRAAELGPQAGLAWYEKARFYQDARDSLGRSEDAWRTYLNLGPTGPRAARAAAALRKR